MNDTLVVIPARVASTRLPNKMLADIGGKPLIVRTFESVKAAEVGDVIVACDGKIIADAIENAGGTAILTDPSLPSGTDRVHAAYKEYDKQNKYKFVINVQGDMPFVEAKIITATAELVRTLKYDMSTIASKIKNDTYLREEVVKPVIAFENTENGTAKDTGDALYFSRSPVPFGGPYYKHIGIYGFRAEMLEKFVSLPQGRLEKTEKLEQLRALENGMSIGIKVLDLESPISVDTATDLYAAREYFEKLA
ncbi:MAG: 3-deoxy-manno-octulosonate cytidylyltransferase [Alphaproteobacteria bacterium]|nr:3-deoxy-manno-octulosonate cytidylyltransferase [Alphaproteobacteria bacterium]